MAQIIPPSAISTLRAASFRLSSIPTAELPRDVGYIAQSLAACKDLLCNPESVNQKESDAGVVLHRYQTQISTLLQDRTVEGRWAAVVLVKATIEAGGWATLSKSLAWVRGLLGILKKPDPSITKCLCIITLTRIFMLTWDYPTLIREITTPSLPAFITACLSNMATKTGAPAELRAILESFTRLLPRHPTIFRNQHAELTVMVSSIMGGTPSAPAQKLTSSAPEIKDLARRLFVLLPQCEPKQGSSLKWEQCFVVALKACHGRTDEAFVSVEEDWQSVAGVNLDKQGIRRAYERAQQNAQASSRPAFSFVYAGSEELIEELHWLRSYITTETSAPVTVPLGPLADLLTRVFSVVASPDAAKSSIRFNPGASREEKDALVDVLPAVHVAALELLCSVLDRFGRAAISTTHTFLDQIIWVFQAESTNVHIRASVYSVTKKLLQLIGPSFAKDAVVSLSPVIKACCNDLLVGSSNVQQQHQRSSEGKSGNTKNSQSVVNADAFLATRTGSSTAKTAYVGLYQAASTLFPMLFSDVPTRHITKATRTQMDRTAILVQHKEALVAGVLNPPAKQSSASQGSSLFPFLARQFPQDAAVESLLRPRMPVLQTGRRGMLGADSPDEEEEEDDDEDEDEDEQDIQMQEASPSPDDPSGVDEDVSHMEQDIIDAALADYLSKHPEARRSRGGVDGPASIVDPRKVGAEEQEAYAANQQGSRAEETLNATSSKRPHPEETPISPPKRQRASPVAQSMLPSRAEDLPGQSAVEGAPRTIMLPHKQDEGMPLAATIPSEPVGNPRMEQDDDSEGDDFVVPQIHMGSDSDEEEDEEEERE